MLPWCPGRVSAWQPADRPGAREGAESSTPRPVGSGKRKLWPWHGLFETSEPTPRCGTSSDKATPPDFSNGTISSPLPPAFRSRSLYRMGYGSGKEGEGRCREGIFIQTATKLLHFYGLSKIIELFLQN